MAGYVHLLIYLVVMEVHYVTHGDNVALNKPAFQISRTSQARDADKAVDGNTDPHLGYGSCIETTITGNPWWYADLEYNHMIDYVVIYNRVVQGYRLHDFNVGIMATSPGDNINPEDYTVCATHPGPASNSEVIPLYCPQVSSVNIDHSNSVQFYMQYYIMFCQANPY